MTIPELANGMTIVLIPPPAWADDALPQAWKRDDWHAATKRTRNGVLEPERRWLRAGEGITRFTWQEIDDTYLRNGYTVHLLGDVVKPQ